MSSSNEPVTIIHTTNKQVSNAGTSYQRPQIMWDVITCLYPWYLLQAHKPVTDTVAWIGGYQSHDLVRQSIVIPLGKGNISMNRLQKCT